MPLWVTAPQKRKKPDDFEPGRFSRHLRGASIDLVALASLVHQLLFCLRPAASCSVRAIGTLHVGSDRKDRRIIDVRLPNTHKRTRVRNRN
jgi:hypothetical protein